jgi:hypothetical protein
MSDIIKNPIIFSEVQLFWNCSFLNQFFLKCNDCELIHFWYDYLLKWCIFLKSHFSEMLHFWNGVVSKSFASCIAISTISYIRNVKHNLQKWQFFTIFNLIFLKSNNFEMCQD